MTLRIAPEVLPVAVPFLCIQPLVENAVRHGLESAEGGGHIRIVARDQGPGVRDRGGGRRRGRGPRRRTARARRRRLPRLGRAWATSTAGCATTSATSTAWSSRPRPGAGTKVTVRVPKFAPGVQVVMLKVLVVDDEQPALDELAYLLAADAAGRRGLTSDSATDGLRILHEVDVDAVFLDIQMPGLTGLELAQVLAASGPRRRSSSSPRTSSTPSRPSTCTRSTTSSSRCAPTGWPRRYAGWSTVGERADRAGPRRRPGRRRARRGDPLHQPLRHHPRRGAGRLRPAAHRDRVPPGAQPALDARGGVGAGRLRADPPLAAGLARPRRRGADGRRPLHGRRRAGRHVELGVSRRHTRELRELLLGARTVGP